MKLAVQNNHLGGQILWRSLDPSKKRRLMQVRLLIARPSFQGHIILGRVLAYFCRVA